MSEHGLVNWYTFLGSTGNDQIKSVLRLGNGDIFVGGYASASITNISDISPIRNWAGSLDLFYARITSEGQLKYYSFLGGAGSDQFRDQSATLASNGDIVFTGVAASVFSNLVSGDNSTPLNTQSGGSDAVLGRLDSNTGYLKWYGFFGGAGNDFGEAVSIDPDTDNIYFTIYSQNNVPTYFGSSPLLPYNAGFDAVVLSLTGDGALNWYTFLGAAGFDALYDIRIANNSDLLVMGAANATIATLGGQTPLINYTAGTDTFFVRMTNTGTVKSYSFIGGATLDAEQLAVRELPSGNILVGLRSDSAFSSFQGTAVRNNGAGGTDLLIVQLNSDGSF